MNRLFKLLFYFVVTSCAALAQNEIDSLATNLNPILLNKHFSTFVEDFDFYLELQNLNKSISINTDPNTKWLWASYAISNSNASTSQSNLNFDDMTLPLYQKYQQDSKFNPFRYAFGLAQTGAVGYLAYKHIKKYGFLKK